MHAYASGNGHQHLAEQLGIPTAASIAISGSANNRIIRSTIKHSYATAQPTFYVLGMTFLSRDELPIITPTSELEGRWSNPQNQDFEKLWSPPWTRKDTDTYVELKLKWEWASILDRIEDLQYRILSTVNDLRSRGHAILVYNQADDVFKDFYDHPKLTLFKNCPNVIDGYQWRSVPWQHSQGVPGTDYAAGSTHYVPPEMVHPAPGFHIPVNNFLTEYIKEHNILQ
jgi:hypothetical protein